MTVIEDVGIVKMEHIATVLLENAPMDVKNIKMDGIVTVCCILLFYIYMYKVFFFHLTTISYKCITVTRYISR